MKKIFHKIHIYVSIFFLPAAFIYALTGALYIFGITDKSGTITNNYKIETKKPLKENEMADFMINYFKENNITLPSKLEPKHSRGSITIGGISYSASIRQAKDNLSYEITTAKRSFYGCLVLLHKSKGEYFFDILAIAFSIALVVLYFSGFFVTSFCFKRRKEAFLTFGLGLLVTCILIYLSI